MANISTYNPYKQMRFGILNIFFKEWKGVLDFPGGTVLKDLPANAGNLGSIPGLGRSHMPRSN